MLYLCDMYTIKALFKMVHKMCEIFQNMTVHKATVAVTPVHTVQTQLCCIYAYVVANKQHF